MKAHLHPCLVLGHLAPSERPTLRETSSRDASDAEKNPDLPVGFVLQGATKTELAPEVVAAYEAAFPNRGSKAGAAQFPLLVPTEEDPPGAEKMRAVADALSLWQKPTLVAFSDSDSVFPRPKSGDVFWDRIPGARPQGHDRRPRAFPAGGQGRADRQGDARVFRQVSPR